ncbi:hypothetical protein ACP70R_009944 [Stipagrostis hirtigluma subsp. patula]
MSMLAVVVVYNVRDSQSKAAEYSVTVTGVAGLDPARDVSAGAGRRGASLSPVFNLTLGIDNSRNTQGTECVGALSTAAVSYGGAILARGPVPPFCAEEKQRSEPMPASAWGQDVALPQFLRDRLAGELAAGEAAVDVQVTMPAQCYECNDRVLGCNKAKIGGGPAPCRLDYVYPRPEPAEGSTG